MSNLKKLHLPLDEHCTSSGVMNEEERPRRTHTRLFNPKSLGKGFEQKTNVIRLVIVAIFSYSYNLSCLVILLVLSNLCILTL